MSIIVINMFFAFLIIIKLEDVLKRHRATIQFYKFYKCNCERMQNYRCMTGKGSLFIQRAEDAD